VPLGKAESFWGKLVPFRRVNCLFLLNKTPTSSLNSLNQRFDIFFSFDLLIIERDFLTLTPREKESKNATKKNNRETTTTEKEKQKLGKKKRNVLILVKNALNPCFSFKVFFRRRFLLSLFLRLGTNTKASLSITLKKEEKRNEWKGWKNFEKERERERKEERVFFLSLFLFLSQNSSTPTPSPPFPPPKLLLLIPSRLGLPFGPKR
jgi:hypothetical protein